MVEIKAKAWIAPSDEEVAQKSRLMRLEAQTNSLRLHNENRRVIDKQLENAHREMAFERRRSLSATGRYPFTEAARARAGLVGHPNALGRGLGAGFHGLDLHHRERRNLELERERQRIAEHNQRIEYAAQQQRSHQARQEKMREGEWMRQQQLRQKEAELKAKEAAARDAVRHQHEIESRQLAEQREALRRREQHQEAANAALRRREIDLAEKEQAEARRQAAIEQERRQQHAQAQADLRRRKQELEDRQYRLQAAELAAAERKISMREYQVEEERRAGFVRSSSSLSRDAPRWFAQYRAPTLSVPNSPERPAGLGHRRFASDTHLGVDPPQLPHFESPTTRPLSRSSSSRGSPLINGRPSSFHGEPGFALGAEPLQGRSGRPVSAYGEPALLNGRRVPRREDTIKPGDVLYGGRSPRGSPLHRGVNVDDFPHSAPSRVHDDFASERFDQNASMFGEPEGDDGALFPAGTPYADPDTGRRREAPMAASPFLARTHSRGPSAASMQDFGASRSTRTSEAHPDISMPFGIRSRHNSSASQGSYYQQPRSRRESETPLLM